MKYPDPVIKQPEWLMESKAVFFFMVQIEQRQQNPLHYISFYFVL